MDAFTFSQAAQLVELACCPPSRIYLKYYCCHVFTGRPKQTHTRSKCLLLAGFPCYRCHYSTLLGDKSFNRGAFKKDSKLNSSLCPGNVRPPYTAPSTVDVLTQPARRLAIALSFSTVIRTVTAAWTGLINEGMHTTLYCVADSVNSASDRCCLHERHRACRYPSRKRGLREYVVVCKLALLRIQR